MNFNLFNRASEATILVVGDLMLDNYLIGDCDRISPEAPVQIVDIKNERNGLGGAGNVVSNLVDLGAKVGILSVLGNDTTGELILEHLKEKRVQKHISIEEGRINSKKNRILVDNHQILRFDKETRLPIAKTSENQIIDTFNEIAHLYDIFVLSDYAKGVLTDSVVRHIISYGKAQNKKVIVDPKVDDFNKYKGAFLLTPNKSEASIALGVSMNNTDALEKALKRMKSDYDLEIAMITLNEEGIAFYDHRFNKRETYAKEVYDVTGAGDTVLACLALGFALELDNEMIVDFANAAAGIVVGKSGSATTTIEEIKMYYSRYLKRNTYTDKVVSQNELKGFVEKQKQKGYSFVFTNGCFDILHAGHISYLQEAKNLGDYLIVGINSDDSVKRLKGNDRPINSDTDRAKVLAALSFVDWVVVFKEDTPLELIKMIKPDILTKGSDYTINEVVGREHAGKVELIDFLDDYSTTSIIERINGQKRNSN